MAGLASGIFMARTYRHRRSNLRSLGIFRTHQKHRTVRRCVKKRSRVYTEAFDASMKRGTSVGSASQQQKSWSFGSSKYEAPPIFKVANVQVADFSLSKCQPSTKPRVYTVKLRLAVLCLVQRHQCLYEGAEHRLPYQQRKPRPKELQPTADVRIFPHSQYCARAVRQWADWWVHGAGCQKIKMWSTRCGAVRAFHPIYATSHARSTSTQSSWSCTL